MRIVHFSDIHFGQELEAITTGFLERLAELDPDVVVASGDFTMAGRHREYRSTASFLEQVAQPIVATPGNHDIPVYNLLERFGAPLKRYERYITPLSTDRFVSDEIALFSVNSARPWDLSFNWSHGRLSDEQIKSTDAFFESYPGRTFSALVVHHPFYIPDDLPGFRVIGNGQRMLQVLAKHRVNAVLTGHLHRQFTATQSIAFTEGKHEISLFQVATVASSRRRDQPNAFAVIQADGDSIHAYPEVWNGARFEPGELAQQNDLLALPRTERSSDEKSAMASAVRDRGQPHSALEIGRRADHSGA